MTRIKKCLHCAQPFIGRRDAKTCSAACRKALQRKRQLLDAAQGHGPAGSLGEPGPGEPRLPNLSADFNGLAGQSL